MKLIKESHDVDQSMCDAIHGQLDCPRLILRTWRVSHASSNLESLQGGFKQRSLGISFARLAKERLSSPSVREPEGTTGIVYAEVNGRGLDYSRPDHSKFIDSIYDRLQELKYPLDYMSAVNYILTKCDVDWVSGWNGIGKGNELHVLNAKRVHIVKIIPTTKLHKFSDEEAVVSRKWRRNTND